MDDSDYVHLSAEEQTAQAVTSSLVPIAQVVMTLFVAGVGMMVGCTIGSLVWPTPPAAGAIVGGLFALVLFGTIGCCATGLWTRLLPHTSLEDNIFAVLPHVVAVNAGGYSSFTVIVTVHKLENVKVSNRYMTKPQFYVEVMAQGNPAKTTCVKPDGEFNEQFRLHITPSVKGILFKIKDQQLFGAHDVAFACINVMDIIMMKFPYMLPVHVQAGEESTLKHSGKLPPELFLSFTATDDYDMSLVAEEPERDQASQIWTAPQYGSIQYVPKVQFNRNLKLDIQQQDGTANLIPR